MGIFRHGVVLSLAGGLLTWAAVASAQDYKVKVTPRPAAEAAPSEGSSESGASTGTSEKTPGTVGGYAWGGTPQGTKAPRRRAPRIKKQYERGTPLVTYPGFRVLADGTTVIWVTVSKTVPVRVEQAKGQVSYLLDGAHVQVWNNTNPLVTTHFRTPVARTKLHPGEVGARLVVELREAVEPVHEIVSGPRGSMLLRIQVPPSAPAPTSDIEASGPNENMADTAPDPEPVLDTAGEANASASASANVDAKASLSFSSKKSKKEKRKRRRKRRR